MIQTPRTKKDPYINYIFIAACLWPVSNFYQVNFGQLFGFWNVLPIFVLTAVILLAGFLAGYIIAKNRDLGKRKTVLLFLSLIYPSLFLFQKTHSFFVENLEKNEIFTGALLLALIVFLVFSVLSFQLAKVRFGGTIIGIFILVSFVFSALQLGYEVVTQVKQDKKLTDELPLTKSKKIIRNNVYYIILDGYPGGDFLKKYLRFENSNFINKMKKLDFRHLHRARSIYFVTFMSLAAIVDADVLATEKTAPYSDRGSFYPRILNSNPLPRLFRHFKDNGSSLFLASNHWGGCPDPNSPIECLNDDNPFQRILNYQLYTFLESTPMGWIFVKFKKRIRNDDAVNLADSRLEWIKKSAPFFFFIHDLRPHDSYQNSDCSFRLKPALGNDKVAKVAQIKCLNKDVIRFVSRVVKSDPSAIIVIQSDHGSGFKSNWKWRIDEWTEEARKERSEILSLVRVPSKCKKWIKPDFTQVNVARLIMGCSIRADPKLVPNHSYGSLYETSPDFGKVFRLE